MSAGQEGQEGQHGIGGGGQGGRGGRGGTGRESLRLPAVIVSVCILVVGLSLFATIMYASHVNGEQKARSVATCERGNIVRAKQNDLIRFLNEKFGYTGVTTPLVVCSEVP